MLQRSNRFNEAINRNGGPAVLSKSNPDQFNMLTGLANMAYAIEELQSQVAQLSQEIQKLKSN